MQDEPLERVAAVLRASGESATARTVAGSLGLHVTTARYHLDRLVAEGRATRGPASRRTRGRPEFAYTLVDADAARAELVTVLASLVERRAGSSSAISAGEEWARSLPPSAEPDAAVAIERELTFRGFAPRRTDAGMDLLDCPFREAARRSPTVVCALHLGLTRGMAAQVDPSIEATLEPFVTESLCRIRLTREPSAA